jgi:4-hydroxy-4-methyl-2-oxoglutarate aldolase
MKTSDRESMLKAFADLRVADVRDGMDNLMMHGIGTMEPDIRPLHRIRAYGIARTCRYVPYDGVIPSLGEQAYWTWSDMYYTKICPYPWVTKIQDGDFIVIDMSGLSVGLMGSDNTLGCARRGAKGFVSNGGVRDTDEIILQKIPFWSRTMSQTMVQGRLRYDADDVPVSCGGVLVHPGDVVVADGDGVVVVPKENALDVARLAHAEHDRDKKRRRDHYEALGMRLDETVR